MLLVEDDPLARRVSRVLLEDAGFAVVAAGTGAEAERSMREHAIDVVLTDLNLPDTSGRALASALRALRPELGVVFVSGHDRDHPEVTAATREHGAAFIPKPVDMDQVTAALRGALARGAATS